MANKWRSINDKTELYTYRMYSVKDKLGNIIYLTQFDGTDFIDLHTHNKVSFTVDYYKWHGEFKPLSL